MKRVIVIGGGAAGMMAAIFAARNGNKVAIYEKNEKTPKDKPSRVQKDKLK